MKCAESLELRQALTVIVSAGIAKGFCDGIQHAVEQGKEKLELQDIKAYDPESEGKFVVAMQALKDLKYPLIDELEKLKDAPMDVIMASLYLESDTVGLQNMRELLNPILIFFTQACLDSLAQAPVCPFYQSIRLRMFD
ncbi:hypothetical protein Tco_0553586 [Tanacetum coccineum]